MARIDGPVNTCDRHFGDAVATSTITFTINGHRYEIDVCDEHERLFHLTLAPWVHVAHEQTAGLPIPAQASASQPARPTQPARSEPLIVVRSVERIEPEPIIEPEPVEVPDVTGLDRDLIRDWRFTKTASNTMADRGLAAPDVWRVLQDVADGRGGVVIKPGMTPDTKEWTARGVTVVVNPSTRMVITAYRPRRMSA